MGADRVEHRELWPQIVLVLSVIPVSWYGMMLVHEAGHVIGAALTGATVDGVIFDLLAISRTDVSGAEHPLVVVWAGPLFGIVAPLVAWGATSWLQWSGSFLWRFFAGFCLIANGCYLGIGAFEGIGDCGDLLANGAPKWQLWVFGAVCVPLGLAAWHGLGRSFGLGPEPRPVGVCHAMATSLVLVGLIMVSFVI